MSAVLVAVAFCGILMTVVVTLPAIPVDHDQVAAAASRCP